MDPFPFSNPLDGWLIYQIAFLVGFVVFIRTYMRGPECPSNAKITGKIVIITGSNSGIGRETALLLARRGGRIILACRNEEKGEEDAKEIRSESGNSDVVFMKLDLSSFSSVRQFAEAFSKEYEHLDLLVNNAGIMFAPFSKTEDGHELHFQVNYLSQFLLTSLLLDKLKAAASGRIINVSAIAHRVAQLHFDDLNLENNYAAREAYGQSKLALIMFTRYLSKELQGSNVTVNALHPGLVTGTQIMRHNPTLNSTLFKIVTFPLTWLLLKTPRDGAQTIVYLAVAPELDTVTGKYFSDCQVKELSKEASDDDLAQKLWDISVQLTKEKTA